jgi:antitoxin component YwqK of YwqJK toxin-antitoxin module
MKQHVVRHKDGSIWAKGKMAGGVCDGYWEWFRKDGSKMRSGHFRKGTQVGEWTTYDRKGRAVKVTLMKDKAKPGTCSRGHAFRKSAARPVCPKCWPGYYRKRLKK